MIKTQADQCAHHLSQKTREGFSQLITITILKKCIKTMIFML